MGHAVVEMLALLVRVLLGCGVVEAVVQAVGLNEVDKEAELHALLLAEWVVDGEEVPHKLMRVL